MRRRRGGRILADVDGTRLTLRVDVERDGDFPRGRVSDEAGATRAFVGWLGLVATLDALISPSGASLSLEDQTDDRSRADRRK
jgi:hypothetical protein